MKHEAQNTRPIFNDQKVETQVQKSETRNAEPKTPNQIYQNERGQRVGININQLADSSSGRPDAQS